LSPPKGYFLVFAAIYQRLFALSFLMRGRAADEVRRPRLAMHLEHVQTTVDHYSVSFVGAEIPLEDDYPHGNTYILNV
jgi:hypothetical protein